MYEVIFLLYLGKTIDVLDIFLLVSLILLGIFLAISYMLYIDALAKFDPRLNKDYKKNEIEIKKTFDPILKKWSKVFLFMAVLEIFLPSKNILYTIAAVKSADIVYHHNKHIPKIVDDAMKYIQLKLEKEIKNELKTVKPK